MKYLIIAVILSSTCAQAGVMKCVDAKGNVTFSDAGCASAKMGQHVQVAPTNTLKSSNKSSNPFDQFDEPDSNSYPERQSSQDTYRQNRRSIEAQQLQARQYEERQRAENEARMANFNNKGRTPTRSQRSSSTSSYSATMPPAPPRVITNCDGAGCWDNQGTRYNKGGGDTYFPSTGGSCQGVGGQMRCN